MSWCIERVERIQETGMAMLPGLLSDYIKSALSNWLFPFLKTLLGRGVLICPVCVRVVCVSQCVRGGFFSNVYWVFYDLHRCKTSS